MFLKTCFSLEIGFLLFLELQKSLLVSFRGAEHNGGQSSRDTLNTAKPPHYQSRDDLHTTTQNMADEPTLANGIQWQSYQTSSIDHFWDSTTQNLADYHYFGLECDLFTCTESSRWLAYHYTNLADEPTLAEPNGKGLQVPAFTISEIPHSIFSKHIFA